MTMKIIITILILGVGFAAYREGYILKNWRKDLKMAMYYMTAMGIGLHIYWLYLIVTNA